MGYRYRQFLVCFVVSWLSGCAVQQGASSQGITRIANSPSVRMSSSDENSSSGTIPLNANNQLDNNQGAGQVVPKTTTIYATGNDEFIVELGRELGVCYKSVQDYRNVFNKNRAQHKWIAGIGIVTGSIAVPVLAAASAGAAVIAGFGGISGAANAYQLTLDSQGDSPAAAAAVYKKFTEGIQEKLRAELPSLPMGPRAAAFLLELRAYCAMSPLPEASAAPSVPDPVAVAKQKADEAVQVQRQKEAEATAAEAEKRKRAAEKKDT